MSVSSQSLQQRYGIPLFSEASCVFVFTALISRTVFENYLNWFSLHVFLRDRVYVVLQSLQFSVDADLVYYG